MKIRFEILYLGLAIGLLSVGCSVFGPRPVNMPGQHAQTFVKEIRKTVKLDYLIYLPEAYPESKEDWPLILFLHGVGERGNDLEKLKVHGLPKLIATEGRAFPFVIVSPQCPEGGWWGGNEEIGALSALLDDVVARYKIDKDRIYVTGLSMGGFGTWRLAEDYANRFAAIAPICGGGNPLEADRIGHLPAWIFHGARDPVVPIRESQAMVDALKACGGDVRFTIYPDAGHDSWTETYNNPELYEWFLAHRRKNEKQQTICLIADARTKIGNG